MKKNKLACQAARALKCGCLRQTEARLEAEVPNGNRSINLLPPYEALAIQRGARTPRALQANKRLQQSRLRVAHALLAHGIPQRKQGNSTLSMRLPTAKAVGTRKGRPQDSDKGERGRERRQAHRAAEALAKINVGAFCLGLTSGTARTMHLPDLCAGEQPMQSCQGRSARTSSETSPGTSRPSAWSSCSPS